MEGNGPDTFTSVVSETQMKREPLVSIFLPTYARNYDRFLDNAITSVINQTYTNWELFVIDDGSIDGSKDVIQNYCALDSRVTHIRYEKNVGLPALTIGKAFNQSQGEFLAFVFDDTTMRPQCLEVLVNALVAEPEAGMVYGKIIAHRSTDSGEFGSQFELREMKNMHNVVPNSAVMLRRSVVEDVGFYDPNIILKRNCDWDLWIRVAEKYQVRFLDSVVSEEHGMRLPDSLGASCSLDVDIVRKYVTLDRNDRLRPQCIDQYDPYNFRLGVDWSAEEAAKCFLLAVEHAIKTNNVEKLTQLGKQQIEENGNQLLCGKIWRDTPGAENSFYMMIAILYYYEKTAVEPAKMWQQLSDRRAHIILEQQQSFTQQLNSMGEQLNSIVEQSNSIVENLPIREGLKIVFRGIKRRLKKLFVT